MSNVWDDDDFKDGDFYSFKNVPHGTSISGTILEISKASFTDKGVTKVVPQVKLKDDVTGEPKTLTAGAFRLKALFVEKRPQVGDHIKVTQTGAEPIGGGQEVKHWDLEVNGSQPVAPPQPAAPAIPDPAAAQAAIANLTPEQLAQLGLTPAQG